MVWWLDPGWVAANELMKEASMETQTVSEWLAANVDSHDIYETSLLDDLPAPVYYDSFNDQLVTEPSAGLTLHSRTIAEMRKEAGAVETGNPKGAYFPDGVDETVKVFGGFQLSAALDRLLTGTNAGGQFFGRGTAHRACIAHIKEAGF